MKKKSTESPKVVRQKISKPKDCSFYLLETFWSESNPHTTRSSSFNYLLDLAKSHGNGTEENIEIECERPSKTDELLSQVPEEFRSALSYMAYESGHSAGEEEVLCHLHSLIDGLKPAIKDFCKNNQITWIWD